MKRRTPFSTRPGVAGLAGGLLLVSACATGVSPTPELLAPLDQAIAGNLSRLMSAADAGDSRAQLAMSIVEAHGLHGRPKDPRQAAIWRVQALAHRRVVPITQYTAAFDGQPSRVNIIHTPVSEMPPQQLAIIDRCISSLQTQSGPAGACGDTLESDAARRAAWAAAHH